MRRPFDTRLPGSSKAGIGDGPAKAGLHALAKSNDVVQSIGRAGFAAVADRIARSLLAVEAPQVAGVEIGVRAAPARIVGGDYLDVIAHPETPGGFTFAIGNVL